MPRFLMGKQRTTKYVITATNGSRNSQDSICELEKLKSLNREKEKKKVHTGQRIFNVIGEVKKQYIYDFVELALQIHAIQVYA